MIGIILLDAAELTPYLKKYTDVFHANGIKYDLIHWKRENETEYIGDNIFTYTGEFNRYSGMLSKIKPFLGFRRFALKVIKQKKYDKLIILTTQTAFVLGPELIGKYKGKFLFDYRDTSYENLKPYSMYINKIIECSKFTCISSPGFKEYLTPKKDYVTVHNFTNDFLMSRRNEIHKKNPDEKIIIGYIGLLREIEYHKKLIDLFGNDSRFEFRIHGGGEGLDELREYCSKYDNAKVYGVYKETDKMKIMQDFDIICYNYPYSFVNYPALANKFYDGLVLKIPMFANAATFSGQLIAKNKLGISLDENCTDAADKIYEYYRSFDEKEFIDSCNIYLDRVIDEDKHFYEIIKDFALNN